MPMYVGYTGRGSIGKRDTRQLKRRMAETSSESPSVTSLGRTSDRRGYVCNWLYRYTVAAQLAAQSNLATLEIGKSVRQLFLQCRIYQQPPQNVQSVKKKA
jgi:hypothetical protein